MPDYDRLERMDISELKDELGRCNPADKGKLTRTAKNCAASLWTFRPLPVSFFLRHL